MWLLDVNVPRQIAPVLREFGIEAETAESRGWNVLTNGKLSGSGFPWRFPMLIIQGPFIWSVSRAVTSDVSRGCYRHRDVTADPRARVR